MALYLACVGSKGLILGRKHGKYNANLPITANWIDPARWQTDYWGNVLSSLESLFLYITPSAGLYLRDSLVKATKLKVLDFGYYRGYEIDDKIPCRKFSGKSVDISTNAI